MIRLDKTLRAWGTPGFNDVLKQEIAELGADRLSLQQGLSASSSVANTPITVVIHNVAELEGLIRVRAGIFYQGLIGGCSCTDDPTPDSEINEYCDVQLDIDKVTAVTKIALVAGD